MAGEQRVLELRQDGVLVADHAVDERLARRDPGDGVGAHLFLDRARDPSTRPQLTERAGSAHGGERTSGSRAPTGVERPLVPLGDSPFGGRSGRLRSA